MLPAKNRLNLSFASNNQVLGKQKLSSDEFRLIAKVRPDVFKAAVVVSKKVAPKAVDRNRIKRLISEALRGQAIFKGELLVIVKKNIAPLKKDEVKDRLFKLFNKLK